ncbi:MAG: hypothetical protein Q7T20_04090, partial [Saprospiraceae bacterium]|nr:hypothetical protein [Saprospiraceae bacterium]
MTESPTPQKQPVPPKQPDSKVLSLLKKLLRRVENFLFFFVIVLIALYFVLQLPSVQNWLVHKTTNYLSSELGTRVELKRVDIEFFDNVILEGLYIEDLNGDTLLIAQKFSAGLTGNFFSVLWNRLEFSEVSLTHARVHLRKMADQRRGTLNELLYRIGDLFGAVQSKTKKKQ